MKSILQTLGALLFVAAILSAVLVGARVAFPTLTNDEIAGGMMCVAGLMMFGFILGIFGFWDETWVARWFNDDNKH